MTILSLFFYIGLISLFLTGILYRVRKSIDNFLDSFLQNFVGILLIFSGFVKAVDPLGTAYKMEQYFTAFEDTCRGSFLSFLADIFPALSNYSVSFSVFMIVFEIVLGVMLVLGFYKKLSAWLYLLIMIFFTILTGFTYLTGYVPTDANFFEFSKWTSYVKTQMRVTDCGCFGDFIKLDPKISFIKDLFLLLPAIWFLLRNRYMHEVLSPTLRASITGMSLIGFTLFSISNILWQEPVIDFRPFAVGVNIKDKLAAERKAEAEIKIIAFKIRNKTDLREETIPYLAYMDSFKTNANFKESWETLEQIKSEAKLARTKISDFDILSLEGESVTDEFLASNRFNLVIVSPKVKYHLESKEEITIDTVYKVDTLYPKGNKKDDIQISRIAKGTEQNVRKISQFIWDSNFVNIIKQQFIPLIDSVKRSDVTATFIVSGLTKEAIISLRKACGIDFSTFQADDLLVKTIMRSNPGLFLIKEGLILQKWHHKQIPTVDELKTKYLDLSGNKIY